jgi:hypothetical protein
MSELETALGTSGEVSPVRAHLAASFIFGAHTLTESTVTVMS